MLHPFRFRLSWGRTEGVQTELGEGVSGKRERGRGEVRLGSTRLLTYFIFNTLKILKILLIQLRNAYFARHIKLIAFETYL